MKKISIIFSFILLFFIVLSTSSSAATVTDYYPDPMAIDTGYTYKQFFIFDDTLIIITSNDEDNYGCFPSVIKYTDGSVAPVFKLYYSGSSNKVKAIKYYLSSDRKSWVFSKNLFELGITYDDYDFKATDAGFGLNSNYTFSSVDVMSYDFNGSNKFEVLFPKTLVVESTLAEVTQALITEEVPVAQSQVLGTMNILLLCGVGCLAFLTGLVLFGKLFRQFLHL